MKISDIDTIISNNLKRLLVQKNIKQNELVKMTGIAKTTISGYVNDNLPIGKEVMRKAQNLIDRV